MRILESECSAFIPMRILYNEQNQRGMHTAQSDAMMLEQRVSNRKDNTGASDQPALW